jgi:hypothetical protein
MNMAVLQGYTGSSLPENEAIEIVSIMCTSLGVDPLSSQMTKSLVDPISASITFVSDVPAPWDVTVLEELVVNRLV